MNDKFYNLPAEKQRSIINAGFHVFSQNSYKKSPVSEIAAAAGISKSLLFHYFKNKRELYIFLWEESCRVTAQSLRSSLCSGLGYFEQIQRGLDVKLEIMRRYPDMTAFVLRAFYEKDGDVCGAVHDSYESQLLQKFSGVLENLDPSEFAPGLDLKMMYKDMYLASCGYLWEAMQCGNLDADRVERDFCEMIGFWKKIYGVKEQNRNECH